MLQTKHHSEQLSDTIDRKQSSSLYTSLDLVQNFEHEPLFIETLTQNGIDPHNKETLDYANALSYYAQDYCDKYADSLEEKQMQEIGLVANTPYMLHVSAELAHYENTRKTRRLDDNEWSYYQETLKPYAVWFNQKLSDYMFAYPDTKFSEITEVLSDSAFDSFPHKEHAVESQVKNIARGARTEAVGRQLLEDTHIEHAPGTPEDDLRGGDIIIIYKDNRIKVDLKSSLDSIAKLRGGFDVIAEKQIMYALTHNRNDKHGAIVLFPGFTDKDLGDNCRLPDAVAQQRSHTMEIQLQRACNELGL